MQRYFIDAPKKEKITLPAEAAHHLVKVMRASEGAKIEVVLEDHHVYLARVATLAPTTTVEIIKPLPNDSELPVKAILACGVPKTKEKPELIVQKATELGASKIIFFKSVRSISHWNEKKADRKIIRLNKIAASAAEQSHRNVIPVVEYCPNLKQLLTDYRASLRLVAWEESAKQGEVSALNQQFSQLKANNSILAIFGPEGGLTEEEVTTMTQAQVTPVGLGPRILRTETAPLYFMAALSYALELS